MQLGCCDVVMVHKYHQSTTMPKVRRCFPRTCGAISASVLHRRTDSCDSLDLSKAIDWVMVFFLAERWRAGRWGRGYKRTLIDVLEEDIIVD